MPTLDELSPSQLRQAVKLSEQIDALRQRLQSILGGGSGAKGASKAKGKPGPAAKKRKMSPEGRARIAAAAKARWAKFRGERSAAKTTPKNREEIASVRRSKSAAVTKAR